MSASYIPDELIVEILKRLSAKSLLRFMSVSKSWYSLIKNPSFISYHSDHHIQQKSKYLLYRNWYNSDYYVYSDNENFDVHLEFNDDYYEPILKCHKVFCSNGIICFMNDRSRKREMSFVLWNSSLRKSLELEVPHWDDRESNAYWFGFDEASNDYKFVWVVYSTIAPREIRPCGVYIYSVNERVWRRVNSTFSLFEGSLGITGFYSNGVIHWVLSRYYKYEDPPMPEVTLTFSLQDETFGVCKLPSQVNLRLKLSRTNVCVTLMTVKRGCKDCLAVVYEDMKRLNFWVMEEEGKHESWVKDFSMENGRDTWFLNGRMNGEIVMKREGGGVVSLDHRSMKMEPISSKLLIYEGTYMESLVLLL